MSDKKYYEIEYTDLMEGVTFKFKKLNPIEHLGLVTANITEDNKTDFTEQYKKFLINVLWTKDGTNWMPLIDSEGNSKLKEFEDNVAIGLDLIYRFKNEVLNPVFTESKTFQDIIKHQKNKKNTN